MAKNRILTAREKPGLGVGPLRSNGTHEIDPAVESDQASIPQPPLNLLRRNPYRQKLLAGDHAVLPRRKLADQGIRQPFGEFASHNDDNPPNNFRAPLNAR